MTKATGWVLSNNERDDIVIQKDDCESVFSSDDEATMFVVESYMELLTICKQILSIKDANLDIGVEMFNRIRQLINKAEGKC